MKEKIKIGLLRLGDTIDLFDGDAYGTATVYHIDESTQAVHVWRPYVHTGDVQYSGMRVILYIGLEDFTLHANQEVTLLRRGGPLK